MAKLTKIDSNVTGLRIAEEASYKVLPADPTWEPQEPNSYNGEYGGSITTVARNPINPDRQRKKGVTTDLEAGGGFTTDLTQKNFQNLGQGFLFALLRRKPETLQRTSGAGVITFAQVPITDVNGGTEVYTLSNLQATVAVVAVGGAGYTVGDVLTLTGGTFTTATQLTVTTVAAGVVTGVSISRPGRYTVYPGSPVSCTGGTGAGATFTMTSAAAVVFLVGHLINAVGFTNAANNGLKRVTAVTSTTVTVAENLVSETPSATAATLVAVGVQAAVGDVDVDASLTLPALTSTALNFTTLGLTPGEPLFVGGDAAGLRFTTAANNGPVRIRAITATRIDLDKANNVMVTEANTTATIQLFFARVLKNEVGSLIRRITYQQERTLGTPDDALPTEVQAEYITGNVASEFSLNVPSADKVTLDLTYVGADHETNDGPTPLKTGQRPAVEEADAFNTSSDFSRIKMALVSQTDEAPTPLFAFMQELALTINNNVTPNKAVGVLGAFEVTAGTFEVGGSITAYFADVAATAAVRANSDVTLDIFMVKQNAGIWIDVPLIALGDARANVEPDQAITLPLEVNAAAGAKVHANLNHTILFAFFDYLPALADV